MNYIKLLQKKLKSHPDIKLNYKSIKNQEKTINKFLESNSLEEWINNDFYDFNHTQTSFLLLVIENLDLKSRTKSIFKNKIKDIELKKTYIDPYIIIHTDFKRTTESIISLACLSSKYFRIKLKKEDFFIFKNYEERLKYVETIILNHFNKHNGKIIFFNKKILKILSYEYVDINKKVKKIKNFY